MKQDVKKLKCHMDSTQFSFSEHELHLFVIHSTSPQKTSFLRQLSKKRQNFPL